VAEYRLAFRELGLSIGLHGLRAMVAGRRQVGKPLSGPANDELTKLLEYQSLGAKIDAFWCEPANQRANTWLDHLDINSVMLATSLLPDEFLRI